MTDADVEDCDGTANAAGQAGGDAARSLPPGKNRMALESSPYLRMHENNPVDWYPWGPAAFARARAEQKPIFLSVGYSTCYWCHVMERTVFENAELAALMNRLFVNIKVDREERPDVDDIYMTAVHLMRGHGGWPMSVFLTPDLRPFYGATYIPPQVFRQTMQQIHEAWQQRPSEIVAQADRIYAAITQNHQGGPAAAALPDERLLGRAAAQLAQQFDAEYAGFGDAPKFPQPSHLEMLLCAHEAGLSADALPMVSATLQAMARGGIYDQVGRGFHRYSTDREWLVPHFEMMLYDNAQLLHTYARAFAMTAEPQFARIADEIVQFVQRTMTGDSGLFHSALDSETEGEEGRSYVWHAAELEACLTPEQWRLAAAVYGLSGPPAFEGRYVLHWPRDVASTAAALDMSVDALYEHLGPIRDRILAERAKRDQPLLDDKAITAWNGLMIEALAFAGRVLGRADYLALAARAATAVLRTLRDEQGRLLHVARHGTAKLAAYLDDYAALTLALIELHRADDAQDWLTPARAIADEMIAVLWDSDQGGFYFAPASVEHLLVRAKEGYDGALPSGNSLAARALANLAAESAEPAYAGYAAGTFRSFASSLERRPLAYNAMLWALWDYRRLNLPRNPSLSSPALREATSAEHVRISAAFEKKVSPQRIAVTLTIADGWHIQANPATLDFLIATELRAERPDGTPIALTVDYLTASRLSMPAGLAGEALDVYLQSVRLVTTLAEDVVTEDVRLIVRVQACDEAGRCLAPSEVTVSVEP
jgi:uncharacterized protein YyaL (SSP411 family)